MVLKIIKKSGAAAPVSSPEAEKPKVIITKSVRVTKPVTEQVPIKSDRVHVETPKADIIPAKFNPDAWRNWPIASSYAELQANLSTMRPPEPRACTTCGHTYAFPCDDKTAGCMNAQFVKEKEKA